MAASDPAATAAPGRPGTTLRRSVSRFLSRMPLRIKLIAALLTLVIAALAAISVAGAFVLRDYLHTHTDQQVLSAFHAVNNQFAAHGFYGGGARNCLGPYLEAFVPNGTQAACPNLPPGESLPDIPATASWLKQHNGQLVTVRALAGSDSWRVLTHQETYTSNFGPVTGTLIVGEDLGDINATIGRLVSVDLIVGAIVVAILAIVGVAVVRASLRPLTDIERTAGEIAAGDLTRRVEERDPDTEVGSLGRSLNIMLARIEAAFHAQATSEANARRSESRMRQFIADASHELRTPLTTIRGYAEYYRQRGGTGPDGQSELAPQDLDRIMHRVEDEASRMGVLVEDLLLLARIDQQRPLERHPVDVLALTADAVQDARMIAPDRQVTLDVGHGAAFLVLGDEVRLRQVVGNLVNNAITHTPDGTPIEVYVRSGRLGWSAAGPVAITGPQVPPDLVPPPPGAASQTVPAVILEVADHGPGLTEDQAQRVFERFYRADAARARHTGGTGLGLAIVSALVAAHDGAVSVESHPGQGATFRVALPLAPEAQGGDDEEDPVEVDANAAPGPASPWAASRSTPGQMHEWAAPASPPSESSEPPDIAER